MSASNLSHSLTESLSDFVRKYTVGRDASHGWEHMSQVASNALTLYQELSPRQQLQVSVPILLAVAWLHDVSDHKYDPLGKLRSAMHHFLVEQYLPAQAVLDIIDAVSFSNEKALITSGEDYRASWLSKFGEGGLLIRDLVSDSDKGEALGGDRISALCAVRSSYPSRI